MARLEDAAGAAGAAEVDAGGLAPVGRSDMATPQLAQRQRDALHPFEARRASRKGSHVYYIWKLYSYTMVSLCKYVCIVLSWSVRS